MLSRAAQRIEPLGTSCRAARSSGAVSGGVGAGTGGSVVLVAVAGATVVDEVGAVVVPALVVGTLVVVVGASVVVVGASVVVVGASVVVVTVVVVVVLVGRIWAGAGAATRVGTATTPATSSAARGALPLDMAPVWPLAPARDQAPTNYRAAVEMPLRRDEDVRAVGQQQVRRPGSQAHDHDRVASLLGRPPKAAFEVVVRGDDGEPVVIRNAPLLADGTPMPTRYWLVGAAEQEAVGRLEAAGGVRAAQAAVDPDELAAAHARYHAERDAALPQGHDGPRPAGGVGGARRGVKCLHAHYAWFLAGGDDPVGRWVSEQLERAR